jgi:hypothetical protein
MSLPSHAGDDAAESHWRWRCRVGADHGLMSLPCDAGDALAESHWRWRYQVGASHGVMSPPTLIRV